jgi:hypothetical protein
VVVAVRQMLLAGPAADALQNWGILVVGRRRLTPVQLRELRVGVPGEKAKSCELEVRDDNSQCWSKNLTNWRCDSRTRVCKVKVAECGFH